MKIAVVGCGALGSYYGAQLCRAGHEVHFLLRSDYAVVGERGVSVRSPAGDFHVRPRCARAPEAIGPADLVLIGLKTTANDQYPRLLPPLVGAATLLLTLQNGLGNEAALARAFGPAGVFGGLCFVCLNRVAPGVILHTAHGRIVLGEHLRPPGPRAEALAAAFQAARVPCQVTPDLDRAHWEKLIWNVPFNGVGVAAAAGYDALCAGVCPPGLAPGPCLATDALLADPRWEAVLRELMLEVLRTARALGHDLPDSLAEKQIVRTREMGAYKASTLVDFERRLPLELDALFLAPLRYAREAGVATPRLAALCAVLIGLEAVARASPQLRS